MKQGNYSDHLQITRSIIVGVHGLAGIDVTVICRTIIHLRFIVILKIFLCGQDVVWSKLRGNV